MIPGIILITLSLVVVALLGIVTWFLMRRVWPYITAQVEHNRLHRIREQEQFVSVLGSYARGAEGTRAMLGQMQQILSLQTDAIQRLADELEHVPKPKPKAPPKRTP